MSSIQAPPVTQAIALQLAVLTVSSAMVLLFSGWMNAYSLLLGGLISALPNAWFTRRFFRHRGASKTRQIMRDFYTGKFVSLVMTGAGFILAFLYVEPLNTLVFFAGFILTHIVGLLLLARLQATGTNQQTTRRSQN